MVETIKARKSQITLEIGDVILCLGCINELTIVDRIPIIDDIVQPTPRNPIGTLFEIKTKGRHKKDCWMRELDVMP